MDLLALLRPKRKAPPARAWRNWYRALVDHNTVLGFKRAGDEYHGVNVYPTKDLAETEALGMRDFLEAISAEFDGEPLPYDYLGAREDPGG